MFERFTGRARTVVILAKAKAAERGGSTDLSVRYS